MEHGWRTLAIPDGCEFHRFALLQGTPRKPHFASEHDGSSLFGNVIPGVLHTVDLQPFAIQERDDSALVAQLDRGTGQGQ